MVSGMSSPNSLKHGRIATYTDHKCRCTDCRAVAARYQARLYKRRAMGLGPSLVDATGTVRRLKALQTIGYTRDELAQHLGVSVHQVKALLRKERVHVRTVQRVKVLYDRLSMHPKPRPATGPKIRYPSPLAWDDETIDDPAVGPDFGQPGGTRWSTAELVEAWLELERDGYSRSRAAEHLGVTHDALRLAIKRHEKRQASA